MLFRSATSITESIGTSAAVVPMDSVMLVAVRADDFGPQLSLTIVGTPAPNLAVIFNVRL